MRILVTGGQGQLGRAFTRAKLPPGAELVALDRKGCDLASEASLVDALMIHDPDLVINGAAYTKVDQAESEQELAMQINANGAGILSGLCGMAEIPFIHVSTDYVFNGEKLGAYTPDDPVDPLNVYGASKAAGEQSVLSMNPKALIVRTSWVCGPDARNFLTTMLRLARDREFLTVVDDQTGQPAFTDDLAAALIALGVSLSDQPQRGGAILHAANPGPVSWHGFASAIVLEAAKHGWPAREVRPIKAKDFPSKVRRPTNSVFDFAALNDWGVSIPSWRERLPAIITAALEPSNKALWE
jgi:dTDP-4-dehydrorhamnose reductase